MEITRYLGYLTPSTWRDVILCSSQAYWSLRGWTREERTSASHNCFCLQLFRFLGACALLRNKQQKSCEDIHVGYLKWNSNERIPACRLLSQTVRNLGLLPSYGVQLICQIDAFYISASREMNSSESHRGALKPTFRNLFISDWKLLFHALGFLVCSRFLDRKPLKLLPMSVSSCRSSCNMCNVTGVIAGGCKVVSPTFSFLLCFLPRN